MKSESPRHRWRLRGVLLAVLWLSAVLGYSQAPGADSAGLGAGPNGRVLNGTTGRPAAGVLVEYVQLQQGMTPVDVATTNAEGVFRFDELPPGVGGAPALLRVQFQGASYTQPLIPQQSPTEGIQLLVFEASGDKSIATVVEHVMFLEPVGNELHVYERIFIENESDPPRAYVNPEGTYVFSLPGAAQDGIEASLQGEAGMPIPQTPEQKQGNTFAITYPLRPGQSTINLQYTVGYSEPFEFAKTLAEAPGRMFVVVPGEGVQLEGEYLASQGTEPTTGSAIFFARPPDNVLRMTVSGQTSESTMAREESGMLTVIPDPVGERRWIVLGSLGLVMLAGLIYLYRR